MSKIDIKTTVAYNDALLVEAKKAKKSVDRLGPTAKLRAEALAWKTLERVGKAADNVLFDMKEKEEDAKIGQMNHYYHTFDVAEVNKPKKVKKTKKVSSDKPTKKMLAIQAYVENVGKNLRRKDMIAVLIEAADLSENGAKTYYQNIKSGMKGWEI